MSFYEVVLFILGAAFFIISFFVGNEAENDTQKAIVSFGEDDMKKVVDRVQGRLQNETEQYLNDAEDKLRNLSNETIISVDDFSKQTLERIAHNHEEVVFMYHMLQTKEEELKKLAEALQGTKKEQKSELEADESRPHVKSGIELAQAKKAVSNEKTERKPLENAESRELVKKAAGNISSDAVILDAASQDENKNEKILGLYKKKKSILEISKALGLGQGEVKLVIDLYGKRS